MEPSRIYGEAIRCEDRSAQLYMELSVRFYDQVDVSWFWIEMAMQGKQQAGLLQHCLQERVFARDLPPIERIAGLERKLEELEPRAADPSIDIDTAFEIAIQIESSDMEGLCERLTEPLVDPPHVVKKKQEVFSKKPAEKLREAAQRFAASPEVRARLAEIV